MLNQHFGQKRSILWFLEAVYAVLERPIPEAIRKMVISEGREHGFPSENMRSVMREDGWKGNKNELHLEEILSDTLKIAVSIYPSMGWGAIVNFETPWPDNFTTDIKIGYLIGIRASYLTDVEALRKSFLEEDSRLGQPLAQFRLVDGRTDVLHWNPDVLRTQKDHGEKTVMVFARAIKDSIVCDQRIGGETARCLLNDLRVR